MQLKRTVFRLGQSGKCALTAILTLAVFVSLLLSASPALHEQLHPDAAQTSHQCAISIFQQHQLLISNPEIIIAQIKIDAPPGIIASDFAWKSDYSYQFSASRAPPCRLIPLV